MCGPAHWASYEVSSIQVDIPVWGLTRALPGSLDLLVQYAVAGCPFPGAQLLCGTVPEALVAGGDVKAIDVKVLVPYDCAFAVLISHGDTTPVQVHMHRSRY